MKKATISSLVTGTILFAFGTWATYSLTSLWLPLLLFAGGSLIFLCPVFFHLQYQDELASHSSLPRRSFPHEALFLAQTFMALSFLARTSGILALINTKCDKNYDNAAYHLGKNLIIDGYDPNYVKDTLENSKRVMRERICARIRCLKQIGLAFTVTGLFAGLAGSASYILRFFAGRQISNEGIAFLLAFTAAFLMLGALFSLFLPGKVYSEGKKSQLIHRQLITGLSALQSGDSYNAILRSQYTFLSKEEASLLAKEPLPPSMKDESQGKDYERAINVIRRDLQDYELL